MAIANEISTIETAVSDIFKGMTEFDSASVYLYDWTFQDESEADAPWVILGALGLTNATVDMDCAVNEWAIVATIMIPFFDWNQDYTTLQTLKQATIAEFATGNNQNLNIEGFFNVLNITDLSPGAPIGEVYDGQSGTNMPEFLTVDLVINIETREP